jgi:hypothetical protein
MNSYIKAARRIGKRMLWKPGDEMRSSIARRPEAFAPASFDGDPSKPRVGILVDWSGYHHDYVTACREMNVSYELINLFASDWLDIIRSAKVDAFLVWPSVRLSIWKSLFDERLEVMERDLGHLIFPSYRECWIYENKRRLRDWLEAHDQPRPRSWVFYNFDEAMEFAESCEMPIVSKTVIGASGSGVRIIRDRGALRSYIERVFRRGIVVGSRLHLDAEWGFVIFHEYLQDVKEWRMVRIGDSFMGYQKEQVGDYHSGSHAWSWGMPPRPALDLLREVTDLGGFRSMAVDVFVTTDGRYVVNEMQTVFGATTPVDQLRVDDVAGKLIYHEDRDDYEFVPGDFSRNACCNLRVQYVLDTIVTRSATG